MYHPDDAPATDPRSSRSTRAPASHSAIVTPLTLRDRVYGTLSLYRAPDRDLFVDEDLDLALEVASRTSLHIDNARRYTREHTVALALQRRLLPQRPEPLAAVESAQFHQSVDVGGGWFDLFPLSGARTALTVGRVSGTGIQAAMAMGQLRTAIHTLGALDLEPDELLARLDDTVVRLADERTDLSPGDPLRSQDLTADCLYGVYDPLSKSCVIALAGGPQPVIAYPDGTTETADIPVAPPLGCGEKAPFASTRLDLPEGSVVALCTDAFLSVGEAGRKAGQDRLRQILADSGRPLGDLRDEAVRTVPAPSPGTDAVLLLVRTHTRSQPRRHLGAAGRPCGRRHPPSSHPASAGRMEPRRALTHHRTDRQRTGHQRRPLRRPAHHAPPDQGPYAHRRGQRLQPRLTASAPCADQ